MIICGTKAAKRTHAKPSRPADETDPASWELGLLSAPGTLGGLGPLRRKGGGVEVVGDAWVASMRALLQLCHALRRRHSPSRRSERHSL